MHLASKGSILGGSLLGNLLFHTFSSCYFLTNRVLCFIGNQGPSSADLFGQLLWPQIVFPEDGTGRGHLALRSPAGRYILGCSKVANGVEAWYVACCVHHLRPFMSDLQNFDLSSGARWCRFTPFFEFEISKCRANRVRTGFGLAWKAWCTSCVPRKFQQMWRQWRKSGNVGFCGAVPYFQTHVKLGC